MFSKNLAVKSVMLMMLILLLLPALSFAGDVSLEQAKRAAQNWVYAVADSPKVSLSIIDEEVIEFNSRVVGYNFILKPIGHVIVPARDELPPVKLYSFTSSLSVTQDTDVMQWISEELYKTIEALDAHIAELAQVDLKSSPNGKLWSEFDNDPTVFAQAFEGRDFTAIQNVSLGPLLTTTWDQEDPYNLNTPLLYNGQKTLTGCVATAAAQIMKYWKYPATGQSSTSYIWNNGASSITLSRNFSASTYNWSAMTKYWQFDNSNH